MRQLMQNLIGNALKFHKPNEPPTVTVRARVLAEPSGVGGFMCELTVADCGIGLKPTDRDRIFEAFRRVNNPDQYQGNGIALALCRKGVEPTGRPQLPPA